MLRPKLPDPPALIGSADRAPAACSCHHNSAAPPADRPLSPYIGLGAGAVAAVLVVGVVLTALLAAVSVTAVSVSIAALVLRSLLSGTHKR